MMHLQTTQQKRKRFTQVEINHIETLIKERQQYVTTGSPWTPFALCEDIISKLPTLNGNILVISNIEFAIVLSTKYNIDPARITFVGLCDYSYEWSQEASNKMILQGMQVVDGRLKQFFNMEVFMKFDVILGNPPFSIMSGKTKVTASSKFFKKSLSLLKDNGSMGMVMSAVGMSAGQQSITTQLFEHEVLYLSPTSDGDKYFNIGMASSVVVMTKNYKPGLVPYNDGFEIKYVNSNEFTLRNSRKIDISYVPKYTTHSEMALLKKILNFNKNTFQFRHSTTKHITNGMFFGFQARGRIPADPGQFRFGNTAEEVGVAHPCVVDSSVTGEILKSVFCSYIFHWILYKINGADTNACPASLSYFPIIPLDKVYTFDDMVKLFKLSAEESSLIMDWVKTKSSKFWK